MVLDTKWKKFKYSSGNKLICVLLGLVMTACLMVNVVQLTKFICFFEDDVFKQETSFFDTYPFQRTLNSTLEAVQYDLTASEREKGKQSYADSFYEAYKKAEKENRINIDGILYDDSYNIIDSDSEPYEINTLSDGRNIYRGDDGYYYTKYLLYDGKNLADANYEKDGVNFGRTEEDVREIAEEYYINNEDNLYQHFYNRMNYSELENIKFYAVHNDGTVITNVKADTKAFIQDVQNGSGASLVYEPNGKGVYASGGLRVEYLSFYNDDYNIYVQVDPGFNADDRFSEIYNGFLDIKDANFKFVCVNILVSLVLMILLAVVSCRLAGHKEDGLSMAKIDKMPADLHFALMGTAVGFSGTGVGLLIMTAMECFEYGYPSQYSEFIFYKSGLPMIAVYVISMLMWLMILGFMTSLSRTVKCGYPVFRKLLVVRIIVMIYKVLKWIIVGIFKGSGKLFRKTGRALGSYAFVPKMIHKRSVPAVLLYTLFNFVSFGIIILLFAFNEGFTIFCGLLGIVVLLGIDGYLVYRAMNYMKSLDDIIMASEKGEPLPYKTDKLPKSLKVLADNLEDTNAQLQQAVIKAVKDERTKTELITNVSHDLKTPLTSVINYIDLLQKCNINDEDAKKYMAVIAEKSNKLKRLIEDLIEASKVSAGNVTINKTLINLNELAAQAVVEETADIEKNNLQVIFEEPVDKHIVMADGMKIYRVLENLLSNARKYSAPGSRVYARVYSDANYGYFEIKNISREQLNITAEELTERFVRGDQSRSQDGNGLGLSIAKELCRLNNGELIINIDGDLFKATVKLPKK